MALQVRLCGALLLCSIVFCTVESSVFDFLDANHSGAVGKPELYAGMDKLQFNKSDAEMDVVFNQIDSNKSGFLSSEEVAFFTETAAHAVGDMPEAEEERINELLMEHRLTHHLSAQDVYEFRAGVRHH